MTLIRLPTHPYLIHASPLPNLLPLPHQQALWGLLQKKCTGVDPLGFQARRLGATPSPGGVGVGKAGVKWGFSGVWRRADGASGGKRAMSSAAGGGNVHPFLGAPRGSGRVRHFPSPSHVAGGRGQRKAPASAGASGGRWGRGERWGLYFPLFQLMSTRAGSMRPARLRR